MNPTKLKPFVCKLCPAIFYDENALKTHKMVHTKEEPNQMTPIIGGKPFKCGSCASAFFCKRDLDNHHSRAHTVGKKVFKCNFCQSSFYKKGILERHECLSYKCKSCPLAFSSRNDWIKHISVHTGEIIYKCDSCPSVFTDESALKAHQRKPHAMIGIIGKPFKCESCPSTFSQKSRLERHSKIHTGEAR